MADLKKIVRRTDSGDDSRVSQEPLFIVGVVGFLTVLGVFVWQLPHFLAGNNSVWPQYANAFSEVLFHHLFTLLILIILTAFTRTVSLRTIVAFWFLGVFAVHTTLVVLGSVFIPLIGVGEVAIWVAPINQTIVEAGVVLAFYVLRSRIGNVSSTISDGLLIGFAVGAGVGFHEDMTYSRIVSIGPGAEYGSVSHMGQEIWWSYIFPAIGWSAMFNIRQYGNPIGQFTLYHPGWGALLGVATGIAYVHRRHLFAWAILIMALLVSFSEHMSINWRLEHPLVAPPVVGRLFIGSEDISQSASEIGIYTLLGFIAIGILLDIVVLHRTATKYTMFPPAIAGRYELDPSRTGDFTVGSVAAVGYRLRAINEYMRFRRCVLMELYHLQYRGELTSQVKSSASSLYENGRKIGLISGVALAIGVIMTLSGGSVVADFTNAILPHQSAFTCAPCAPEDRFLRALPAAIGFAGSLAAVLGAIGYDLRGAKRRVQVKADNLALNLEKAYKLATEKPQSLRRRREINRYFALFEESSRFVRILGKIVKPLELALNISQILEAWHIDGKRIGDNTRIALGSVSGGWIGAAAGASSLGLLLAGAGTLIAPGVGTAIGGMIGIVIGGAVGGKGGSNIGEGIARALVKFGRK